MNTKSRSVTARLWTVAAVGLAACGVSAQTWQTQTPLPTNRDLNGAAFTSPDHGFIIGQNRALFETIDGGQTWTERSLADYGADPYYDIRFFDAQRGWITGNNNDQLFTTDGGATWQPMSGLLGTWNQIVFLSPTEGYFSGGSSLAVTTDGGQTWQRRAGWPECPVIYGMDFRAEGLGLIAGSMQADHTRGVYRTQNGGTSWTRTLDVTCNDVLFLDDATAVAAGVETGRVYKSTDYGQTWDALPTVFGSDGPLGDLCRVGDDGLAGCSAMGDVWISGDLGQTWTKTLERSGDLPFTWELNFLDADHGWLTGPHGMLYRTSDGGMNWEYVTNGIGAEIQHVEMLTDRFGMALGNNGYLLRTEDGGQRWSIQKLELTGQIFGRDENLTALDIVDESFAVAAGPGGTVFRTLDSGLTWESIGYPLLPGGFAIEDVEFIDRDRGYLVGTDNDRPDNKGIYETLDGGLTWTRPFDDTLLGHIDAVDHQHIWIMHLGSRLHASDDGGQTWSDTYLPANYFGGSSSIKDMEFISPTTGWVCGWWDYIARTTDGGDTWETFTFGNNHDIRVALGLAVISADEVFVAAVTEQGRPYLLHTTDGGQNWSRASTPDHPYGFSEIDVSPNGSVWVGGFGGAIISNAVHCTPDFNGDGDVNTLDVLAFLNAWTASDADADFNGDGEVNTLDVLAFLNAWNIGC